jgi:hypothetical protein
MVYRSLLVSLRAERLEGMGVLERCRQAIVAAAKLVPPVGGYIEAHALAGVHATPTAEELHKEEELMKRVAARRQETGVEVNVMSTYCGQRISFDRAATEPKVRFAFLAELASSYWDSAPAAGAGGALAQRSSSSSSSSSAKEMRAAWAASVDAVKAFAAIADAHLHPHGQTQFPRLSKAAISQSEAGDAALKQLAARHVADVGAAFSRGHAWNKWQQDVVGVTWQSLCLQLLCQKVRVEKDIDDGTYTTVCPDQVRSARRALLVVRSNRGVAVVTGAPLPPPPTPPPLRAARKRVPAP